MSGDDYKKTLERMDAEREKEIEEDMIRFNELDVEEGEGPYCCGKRTIESDSGLVYYCLNCQSWEYTSS